MGAVTNDHGKKTLASDSEEIEKQIAAEISGKNSGGDMLRHRQFDNNNNNKDLGNKTKSQFVERVSDGGKSPKKIMDSKFRKIVLLIIAVTVHNIPG